MRTITKNNKSGTRLAMAIIVSGISMWVLGGLYHNLLLPAINQSMHPHHEGLGLVLVAYLILGLLMVVIYQSMPYHEKPRMTGLKVGVLVGIIWVFPHGLTMAAVHQSSIGYEISNTAYHIVEQGIGGIILGWILAKKQKSKD